MLDKPVGITSNAAIQRVKRLLSAAKAGHVGTLDPLASGLLPVCLGEATKFSADAFGADKKYDAQILLGVTTTTADIEGEVIERRPVAVTREQVLAALQLFTGALEQTPPMYSALKRDGKPLYAYARAGQTVSRRPRPITVHAITLRGLANERLAISVHCSKGTYIRVLAEDLGRVLGCGATLAGLRRTAIGEFGLERAVTLGDFEGRPTEERPKILLPVDALVAAWPEMRLEADVEQRVRMGQARQIVACPTLGIVRLYGQTGRFLGLGELQPGGRLVPMRLIAQDSPAPANFAAAGPQAPKNA